MSFSTGLKGIKPEDAQAAEDLVFATLSRLVSDGLPADAVEAGVNAWNSPCAKTTPVRSRAACRLCCAP